MLEARRRRYKVWHECDSCYLYECEIEFVQSNTRKKEFEKYIRGAREANVQHILIYLLCSTPYSMFIFDMEICVIDPKTLIFKIIV